MTRRPALLLLTATLSLGCLARHYRSTPRVATVGGDPVVQFMRRGRFPSATRPPMVALSRHSDPPRGRERLIALTAPAPRAYAIGLLDRFEIVNDDAGGVSFVVTRCALTQVAAVYRRSVEGRDLTFENSGALWRDTLVLRDVQTGSLWSAATGAALVGPLAGRRLTPIPAVYTTARAWSRAFPTSTYMDLGKSTSIPFLMRLYGASPWQGMSGVRTSDRRHDPKDEFLSVAVGDEAFAFTEERIRGQRRLREVIAGRTIEVEWDDRLEAPRARLAAEERPVVPMYWFALDRHFETVRIAGPPALSPGVSAP